MGGADQLWGTPDREARPEPSDRQFGWWTGGILSAIAIWPMLKGRPVRLGLLTLGVILLVLASLAPCALRSANRLWQRLGAVLARVTNPLISGLLFAAVITPFGFALRALGFLSIRLRIDRAVPTYWETRTDPRSATRMRMQF